MSESFDQKTNSSGIWNSLAKNTKRTKKYYSLPKFKQNTEWSLPLLLLLHSYSLLLWSNGFLHFCFLNLVIFSMFAKPVNNETKQNKKSNLSRCTKKTMQVSPPPPCWKTTCSCSGWHPQNRGQGTQCCTKAIIEGIFTQIDGCYENACMSSSSPGEISIFKPTHMWFLLNYSAMLTATNNVPEPQPLSL